MSGHSHWHSIKHQKGIADAKKGKTFSKLARLITIAAKEKGGDPATNPGLRLAVEKAKEFNMPKENVERAIKKGTGELEGEKLEEVIFEAFGPGGIAIIIEGITDNRNRALGEIKRILTQNNGKMANEGSVRWLFEKKGVVILDLKSQNENSKNKENLELAAIEAGAEDINWIEENMEIYAKPESLEEVKKKLEGKGIKIESSSLGWIAKEEIGIDEKNKESAKNLFSALDESDEVQEIYSNLKE
ncbi:MAG: YebC/PmpR family DNA-binding transcriptional regulator [Patescibacteria group bacterium]|jgi:YebC/PmpR family DNA-binding regulatory protein